MEPMEIFKVLLLVLLVCCAIGAGLSKKLLTSVIIFMSYSCVMAIVWAMLQSPDLAITEAAVGAGVSTVLFFMCLRRIGSTEKSEKAKGAAGKGGNAGSAGNAGNAGNAGSDENDENDGNEENAEKQENAEDEGNVGNKENAENR